MDNLTHTATGLFLSRAGLNRLTPLATPILIVAANAPDIDIVTAGGGMLNYLHYHRHITHSLPAAPVLAVLSVAVVRIIARRPVRWAWAVLMALVAVLSHLLLDYTNVYGIRLLLPFSPAWLRLDLTPVVDFWIWAVLLLSVAGPFLSRLVTSEITSSGKRPAHHGRGFAWLALLFLLFYNGGRAVLHTRALAMLDARLYDGQPARQIAALPLANPFAWRGVVETADAYQIADVDVLNDFDPRRAMTFRKADVGPVMESARRTRAFQEFLQFAQIPFWSVVSSTENPNERRVELVDLRFGTPAQPGFLATGLVTSSGAVTSSTVQFGLPPAR